MHERIRDRLLAAWGKSVASHPVITLLVCLVLVAASVTATVLRLEFHADRSQLIDPDQDWNQQYAAYKENFPRYRDVIVVLDGEPGDRIVDVLAMTVASILQNDERVKRADAGFDAADAGARFFKVGNREQFEEALEDLAGARELAAAENANAALGLLLSGLNEDRGDPGALDRLEQFLAPYLAAAEGRSPSFAFLSPHISRWQPLASNEGEGRLRYVSVQLAGGGNGVNQMAATLDWVRQRVGEVIDGAGARDTAWGVTGIPAIEADETSQAIHDSTVASLIAIALITLVMFVAFRGLTVPLLAAMSLLIGMAWSFGWLIVSVGHLQLLSVVFSVILLGMGIDFALLFVSRLELVQDEHRRLASATARVYRRMGPGMLTGAVTTAAAFAATALTDFKGMAEMGIIAAGGILLCLIAVLSAFPALLALTGRWKRIIRHRPGGEGAHFAFGRLDFVDMRPRTTLVVAGVVVACLVALAFRVEYDPDIMRLQSPGVESVQWAQRIVDADARSVWSAVVLATPQQAPSLTDRLRGAGGVSGVGGMGMFFPADRVERERMIAEVRDRPVEPRAAEPGMASVLTQLAAVRAGLRLRGGSAPADIQPRLAAIGDHIAASLGAAGRMTPQQRERTWTVLNTRFVKARDALGTWADGALAPGPPTDADLPPLLGDMWVGEDGSWLLEVFPEADPQQQHRSILAPERLGPFVENVRNALAATDVKALGAPVQIYESSRLIKSEYIKAAAYAIAAILVLLCLDFRRLADALCAILPVTVGFVGAFGLMGLLGVPLNFANIIVLPIIFGIGVNAGVQVVHRWRQEPMGLPKGLSGATGRGITLTMMTTMIGFGCLLIAEHRGIRSLGFVMVIGLAVTLLACYTVLPAALRLRGRAAAEAAGELFGPFVEPPEAQSNRLRRSA
ncbi:MAG: MMPL family transporter [Planctomycetota bacterium]|jgi:hopanoid biosynthesis associated RND transporter like protein HpnN